MMTFEQLAPGTIFQFASDHKHGVDTVYEKVGTGHFRRGVHKINHVCIPIGGVERGLQEPVIVVEGKE